MTMTTEQRAAGVAELPKTETRAHGRLELRAGEDPNVVKVAGYAAVWDAPYNYGSATDSPDDALFVERVRRGAFSKTLAEGDQRLLAEHAGMALARTKSGTLRLTEDDHGLLVEAELDAANPYAAALRSALARGDIDGMSFGFRVVRQSWSEDYAERDLLEVRLDEVSIVSWPAYTATEVGLRSLTGEQVDAVLDEVRAGKALSSDNAKLLKAAHDALTELLSQANPDDVGTAGEPAAEDTTTPYTIPSDEGDRSTATAPEQRAAVSSLFVWQTQLLGLKPRA